jgi:hypothetical protein
MLAKQREGLFRLLGFQVKGIPFFSEELSRPN